ncbi:hypothetical protein Tco_0549221 [Tanacetum coccineum]
MTRRSAPDAAGVSLFEESSVDGRKGEVVGSGGIQSDDRSSDGSCSKCLYPMLKWCEEDFKNRIDSLIFLGALDRTEARDLAQKAKIKWALEGDENTRFFHGSLKKKRRQLAIKGILKNGDWIEEPGLVKAELLAHFRHRFQQPTEQSGIAVVIEGRVLMDLLLNSLLPSRI